MTMTSQFSNLTSSSKFFDVALFILPLVKFSYLSKFYVNIITGSGIMIIFFYKGLTRNLEIGNTTIWVLPNIWRLGRVRDIKIGTNVSNEMLLHSIKCQGYSFYRFWVIKEKPTGGGKITRVLRILLLTLFHEPHIILSSTNTIYGLYKLNE